MIVDAGLLILMCILAFSAGFYWAHTEEPPGPSRRTFIDTFLRRDVTKL